MPIGALTAAFPPPIASESHRARAVAQAEVRVKDCTVYLPQGCTLYTFHLSPLTTCHLPLTTRHSPLTTHHSPLTTTGTVKVPSSRGRWTASRTSTYSSAAAVGSRQGFPAARGSTARSWSSLATAPSRMQWRPCCTRLRRRQNQPSPYSAGHQGSRTCAVVVLTTCTRRIRDTNVFAGSQPGGPQHTISYMTRG